MEPTLAEEIRALLLIQENSYPMAYVRHSALIWDAFPALAGKMLAVIEERDHLRWEAECLQVEAK